MPGHAAFFLRSPAQRRSVVDVDRERFALHLHHCFGGCNRRHFGDTVIPKQTAYFKFGSVNQASGAKQIQIGELIAAVNVQQTSKKGVYSKRAPFKKTSPTYSAGSVGVPTDFLPGASGALLMRDSLDQSWVYGSSTNIFSARGTIPRPFASWEQTVGPSLAAMKSYVAVSATQIWQFVDDAANNRYIYNVLDAVTGVTLQADTYVTATSCINYSFACDGTYAFVLFFDDANNVYKLDKYVCATPGTAATRTTYYTPPGTFSVDFKTSIVYMPGIGKTAAICATYGAGGSYKVTYASYVDVATGQPAASPTPLEYTETEGAYDEFDIRILANPAAEATYWWYAIRGRSQLFAFKVKASDLTQTKVTLDSFTETLAYPSMAGYYDGTNTVVYMQHATSAGTHTATIAKYVYNGSSTTETTTFLRGATLAGSPFYDTASADWQFITGFDDTGTTTAGYQRCLHLRNSSGTVVMQMAAGEIGSFNLANVGVVSTSKYVYPCVLQSPIAGQVVSGLVTITPSGPTYGRSYSQMAQLNDKAIVPGGIPSVFGRNDNAHEITPLLYPSFITQSGGSGDGPTAVAALYSYQDTDGTLYRSSPIVSTGTVNNGASISVPTLRHGPNIAHARIEFYASSGGGQLQFQTSVANDPTADTHSWTETHVTGGETLYTAGGGLSAAPLPPCQTVGYWRNRVFAASGNVLWFSQELEPGAGPRFNEILRATWSEINGQITAICPIDWNYCAIFTNNSISVIGGMGPDGLGKGNYQLQTLSANVGCSNPQSVVNAPAGCFFQETGTGRIHVITPSLQVFEAAPGAREYSTYTITSACWVQADKHIRFGYAGGCFVVDAGNPTEGSPFGQSYRWDVNGLTFSGQCVDTTGPVTISSTGKLYRQSSAKNAFWRDDYDASSATKSYIMQISTGRMHPAGAIGDVIISRVQVTGTKHALSSGGTLLNQYTACIATSADGVTVQYANLVVSEYPVEGSMFDMSTRPAGYLRNDGIYVSILETPLAYPAGNDGAPSFDFEGIAIEFQPRGRAKALNSTLVF